MLINQAYSMMNNIQNVVGDQFDIPDDPEMKVINEIATIGM